MSEHWRQSTWGDEISLEYGKSLRGYQDAVGPYRVFGSNGPIGWAEEALASGPGIILGRKGAYRGVHFSRDPFFVIDTAYYVKPKSDLDVRWLYYAIIHHKLGEIDDGSPIPSTTRAAVYIQDVAVPPIEEQREIAAVLGALDDKIELNRKTASTLEAMARALYRSWFVDFDPVHAKAKGRAPAHMDGETAALFPDGFGEDGLPVGWDRHPTSDLVSFTKGRSYKSKELQPSSTALISLKSFQRGGGYRLDGLKAYIGEYKPSQVVQPGEIVIALTDVTQAAELIGRATFARTSRDFQTLVASLDVGILRALDEKRTPQEFLHQLFNSNEFLEHALAHTSGTTVLHLAKEAIPTFQMLVPDEPIVEAFDRSVSPLRARVFRVEDENQTLAQLRDTLLPRLMSGDLRVPAARKQVEEAL